MRISLMAFILFLVLVMTGRHRNKGKEMLLNSLKAIGRIGPIFMANHQAFFQHGAPS